jgi:F-type H+-transporting ATPase subunit epsilon
MTIHVEVITQEGRLFEEHDADMVIVPGSEGEMGVLPHHAPVLTTMGFGELRIRKGNAEESFVIYGGVVDIRPGHVIALADVAESSYDVDEAQAEQARTRARELMATGLPADKAESIAIELHRAELAVRVSQKVRARPRIRLKSIEDEPSTETK